MKYIIAIIFLIHGSIHLMGFVKGFNLAGSESLPLSVSRQQAIWWLLSFVLFAIAGAGFFASRNFWVWFALAGILVSSVLIILNWQDAGFGMLPNIIVLLLAVVGLMAGREESRIASDTQNILERSRITNNRVVQESDTEHLPLPVKKWLKASGIIGKPYIYNAMGRQLALMKLKPDQEEWYKAEAEQLTSVNDPAFIWTVEMEMNPLLHISGCDMYRDGKSGMKMNIFSAIPIVNGKGQMQDAATLHRFLGELVWYPSMALSSYITWEPIDDLSARGTMTYGGITESGIFYFNENGDFTKFTALRYKDNREGSERIPWIITVDAYDYYQGIRVPSGLQVSWGAEQGEWTWLKVKIADLRYNI